MASDGKVIYQLNPILKFNPKKDRPSKLDSSEYPGQVVYRGLWYGAGGPEAERGEAAPAPAPGLSNGHIPTEQVDTCQVEVWMGARLVTVVKPGGRRYDAPKRGEVFGQSPKARMRMMNLLSRIRQSAELPWFNTLTFPDAVPSPERVKEIMDVFWVHVVRKFEDAAEVWKRELKGRKSGEVSKGVWVPHYHTMLWNGPERFPFSTMRGEWVTVLQRPSGNWEVTVYKLDAEGQKVIGEQTVERLDRQDCFREWLARTWYEVVGSGDFRHYQAGTSCERVRSWNGVACYASKYLSKADEAGAESSPYAQGRSWGIRGRKHLPLGERLVIECSEQVANKVLRAAKAYASAGRNRRFKFAFRNLYVKDTATWRRLVEYYVDQETPF